MSTGTGHRRLESWAAEGTPLALLSVFFFIDLFLPWSPSCFITVGPLPNIAGATSALIPAERLCQVVQNGLGGSGFGAAALALAVFAWEALRVARISLPMGAAYRSLLSAFLAETLLVLTLLDLIPRFGGLISFPGTIPFGGAFAWSGAVPRHPCGSGRSRPLAVVAPGGARPRWSMADAPSENGGRWGRA
ncbi:MAG: hypothetical protein ACYDC5_11340 [Candidatus Dormibacteria bacterium]